MAEQRLVNTVSAVALILTCVAVTNRTHWPRPKNGASPVTVQFLTREGCVNSPLMLANLRQAMDQTKIEVVLCIVDQAMLPNTDPRRGYATPTILVNDVDLFGCPLPTAPLPPPS